MEMKYNKPSMDFFKFVVEDIITGSEVEIDPPGNPGTPDILD